MKSDMKADDRALNAYHDGELDAAASLELEREMAQNPALRASYERLRELSSRIEEAVARSAQLGPLADRQEGIARLADAIAVPRKAPLEEAVRVARKVTAQAVGPLRDECEIRRENVTAVGAGDGSGFHAAADFQRRGPRAVDRCIEDQHVAAARRRDELHRVDPDRDADAARVPVGDDGGETIQLRHDQAAEDGEKVRDRVVHHNVLPSAQRSNRTSATLV